MFKTHQVLLYKSTLPLQQPTKLFFQLKYLLLFFCVDYLTPKNRRIFCTSRGIDTNGIFVPSLYAKSTYTQELYNRGVGSGAGEACIHTTQRHGDAQQWHQQFCLSFRLDCQDSPARMRRVQLLKHFYTRKLEKELCEQTQCT